MSVCVPLHVSSFLCCSPSISPVIPSHVPATLFLCAPQTEFREDLKGLYRQAGCANKATVFLFDETQIVNESFLEDVNNILSSGEVRVLECVRVVYFAPVCCA